MLMGIWATVTPCVHDGMTAGHSEWLLAWMILLSIIRAALPAKYIYV